MNTDYDSVHRSRLVRLLTNKTACEKIAFTMRGKSALAVHRGWLDNRQSADVMLSFAVMQGRDSCTQAMAVISYCQHTVPHVRLIIFVLQARNSASLWLDYFRLELTYVERLLARRRVLGLKGADGALL